PATKSLKSTDNIPSESGWRYWMDDEGANLKSALLEGHTNGLFMPNDPIHVNLFQWLWVRIIRHHLNEFKTYFNATPRRSQKAKLLPTAAPDAVWRNPQAFGLQHCGTAIPKEAVQELRDRLPLSREHVMRWVPDEFDQLAMYTYEQIGEPSFHHSTGWETYRKMLTLIQDVYR
ncbi:hypothetical protein GGX14DRAFT_380630, partial [Mycena pura]